jgi:hypothetical protein
MPKLDLPKPRRWDFVAGVLVVISLALVGANVAASRGTPPGASIPTGLSLLFALAQMALATASLLVLGKTAREGTLWGNFLAVAGLLAGMSGVLLAAAMWAAG